jgi:hypothetical protein
MVEIAKAMCPNNVEHRCSHASVIKQFGIDEVFYSNKDGQIVCA